MPLISVIVPIYNVEQYLRKCIESIIYQTTKDIEIILVNDGSKDGCGCICNEFLNKDKRIKVIHKENGGLSTARNKGIELATGNYIMFIDSDDWIEEDFCEYLYSLAESEKADIVQCSYLKVYDENQNRENSIEEKIYSYSGKEALELLYRDSTYSKTVIACNKIYKKSLFDTIRFPVGKIHEDEFTTYKLLYKANKIIDTNSIKYYYRQRLGSITNQEFTIKRLDAIEAWYEKREFMKKNNLNDLKQKTDKEICSLLIYFYYQIQEITIKDKEDIKKTLKKEIQKNYFKFIINRYITFKAKCGLNLSIINEKIFFKVYKKTQS